MITFTIIESPFAGDVEANLTYARRAMADCFARGEIPICGHALYTQPGVLDDKKPEERRKGMEATFDLRRALNAGADPKHPDFAFTVQTAVYYDRGISKGMQQGIERGQADGVPYIVRNLDEAAK
jgi:hypothetical protein